MIGATARTTLFQGDNHFVRMDDVQLLPCHLVHHIGIGVARVDQIHPVFERRARLVQPVEFGALNRNPAMIFAISEHTVRPDQRIDREKRHNA